MISFRLDLRSGVPPYLQIVQQVEQSLRLGLLQSGDRLPTQREVAGQLAINPNTVFKAYHDLERAGIIESRPGVGTFIRTGAERPSPPRYPGLRRSLERWLQEAEEQGLNRAEIEALVNVVLRDTSVEGVA